jgi:hypothetical protein
VIAGALLVIVPRSGAQVHVIEFTADSDSRYKIAGQRTPEITVKAGEQVLLRAKDRTKVDGWDLLFKPGTQEFTLTAPSEPGEYVVVCTVICSEDHEGMHMKFTVLP